MTVLWDKIKKNVVDSLTVAIDKTEEMTSVGRIKLEMLQVEHRLDEKYSELGQLVYQEMSKDPELLKVNEKISELRDDIARVEVELSKKEAELGRIKKEEGIDFDS